MACPPMGGGKSDASVGGNLYNETEGQRQSGGPTDFKPRKERL
ncbi:hypothetical protein RISK_001037 [Rhodopirellula islandica]|uniref:Uncharacterized protein n=1 Tax=Rhodopirellula islandica TaxID=595434 RepID=A0A0J1BL28_RHOIS|nr:hypothetical protein RISK_001037 [Rhodopirellula islandica]